MPSLAQYEAVRGRRSPIRIEDLNQARLPSLYAAKAREADTRSVTIAERGLNLREQEMGLAQDQARTSLLTSGATVGIGGLGALETAYPGSVSGTVSSIGKALGLTSGAQATPATLPVTATPAATATATGAGPAATAPLFGGASSAALPAAESAGLLTAGAPSGVASAIGTQAGATATEAAATGATATGASAGSSLLGALGPAGAGLAGGMLGAQFLGPVLGDSTGARVAGGAIGGAASGALAGSILPGPGTAIGALIGGVLGGGTGALDSVIATAMYGRESPGTILAQLFRRRYVGATTYAGYRRWADPLVVEMLEDATVEAEVRRVLVEPCLRGMLATLLNLPWSVCAWERLYLASWLDFSRTYECHFWNKRRKPYGVRQLLPGRPRGRELGTTRADAAGSEPGRLRPATT